MHSKQFRINSFYSNFEPHINEKLNVFYGNSILFRSLEPKLRILLSDEELRKVDRLRLEINQLCYTTVHSALRKTLINILNIGKEEVKIKTYKNHKPYLEGRELDFNLSHSDHYFSFVIADNCWLKVGVDVERLKPLEDFKDIAKKFFSDDEEKYIFQSNDEDQQMLKFYEIWTKKEAFLKMVGVGLDTDLKSFSVSPGMNNFLFNQIDEAELPHNEAFIYTKLEDSFVLSLSLSEDRTPIFREVCP